MTNRKIIAMSSANNWNLLLLFPAIKAPKSTVMLRRFAVNLNSMSYTYKNDRWSDHSKFEKKITEKRRGRETSTAKKKLSTSDKDFAETKRALLCYFYGGFPAVRCSVVLKNKFKLQIHADSWQMSRFFCPTCFHQKIKFDSYIITIKWYDIFLTFADWQCGFLDWAEFSPARTLLYVMFVTTYSFCCAFL